MILSVIIKGLNSKSQTTDGLPYVFLELDKIVAVPKLKLEKQLLNEISNIFLE